MTTELEALRAAYAIDTEAWRADRDQLAAQLREVTTNVERLAASETALREALRRIGALHSETRTGIRGEPKGETWSEFADRLQREARAALDSPSSADAVLARVREPLLARVAQLHAALTEIVERKLEAACLVKDGPCFDAACCLEGRMRTLLATSAAESAALVAGVRRAAYADAADRIRKFFHDSPDATPELRLNAEILALDLAPAPTKTETK